MNETYGAMGELLDAVEVAGESIGTLVNQRGLTVRIPNAVGPSLEFSLV